MSSSAGSSLYDGIPPLVTQSEDFITRCFYGKSMLDSRQRAYAMGLQSPLWLWTHQQITREAGAPKGLRKVLHLVQWLHRNGVDSRHIAILLPLSWKAICKQEFEQHSTTAEMRELPVMLAHHELPALNKRDNTRYQYRAVLYVVDALPRNLNTSAPLPVSEEMFISEAMGAATDAFVICADAGWMAPQMQAKWYKLFVSKLEDEQPLIYCDPKSSSPNRSDTNALRFPSLVGSAIPLCCGRHPGQRQLEYGLNRVEPCCKHLCLSQFACHRPDHVCTSTCHPGEDHLVCSYACGSTLPCGHKCLSRCGVQCNCLEVIEKELPCSHEKLLGLDKETLEPIYGLVHHVFKGVCSDADLPCAVTYDTECARCLGILSVSCFEAQEHNHTREHKTLICAPCKRRERELRAKLLGELLTGVEQQKKKVKAELQRTLHHQRKAAAQGLFRAGTRVEIVDATKCVPPLFAEDDFPGVDFADMEAPNFFQEMDGAYGTFISNHVDVMDRSEVRNLVRLPSGKHVLVSDGGLRMIKALSSSITQNLTLLLTFKGGEKGDADAATLSSEDFATAKTMLNGTYYLAQPVPCDDVAGLDVLTDKVVRVVALDPLSPKNVVVECTLHRVTERSTDEEGMEDKNQGKSEDVTGSGKSHVQAAAKRRRLEPHQTDMAHYDCVTKVVQLTVPVTALEPMTGMTEGKYVFVNAPQRQVRNPHDMIKLEVMLHHLSTVEVPPGAHVTAAPIDPDTPYALLTVVNPPLNCEAARGPCAVLKYHEPRRLGTQRHANNGDRQPAHRGGVGANGGRAAHPHKLPHPAGGSPAPLLMIVPFMFTVGDELTEAEGALDAAAQKAFEQRLQAELTTVSDEMALRNEEDAFHAQQQMPKVTPSMLAQVAKAYSFPVPLPTAADIAAARQASIEAPVASPITTRLAHAKDKLLCKQEALQLSQWVDAMKERMKKDHESDAKHIKYIRSLHR